MVHEREFKTVGIALDSYKVKRFRSVLADNGFETKLKRGITRDTALLQIRGVNIERLEELRKILLRLQYEFANRN